MATTFTTGTDELLCSISDRVATITLNRPTARNSLSDALTPALRETLRLLDGDPTVGAILLTGAGAAFCAGGDIKGMGGNGGIRATTSTERVRLLQERQATLTGRMTAMRKPIVAALPGPAAGAGLSIALACDLRIAAQSAFVVTNYVNLALPGDYGISWLLTRLVGPAHARELMFLSDRINATRCLQIGLVNWVVPDDELMSMAIEITHRLAHGPTGALAAIKANLEHAMTSTFAASLDREAGDMVEAAATPEHAEAVRAFIEKRRPGFHTAG